MRKIINKNKIKNIWTLCPYFYEKKIYAIKNKNMNRMPFRIKKNNWNSLRKVFNSFFFQVIQSTIDERATNFFKKFNSRKPVTNIFEVEFYASADEIFSILYRYKENRPYLWKLWNSTHKKRKWKFFIKRKKKENINLISKNWDLNLISAQIIKNIKNYINKKHKNFIFDNSAKILRFARYKQNFSDKIFKQIKSKVVSDTKNSLIVFFHLEENKKKIDTLYSFEELCLDTYTLWFESGFSDLYSHIFYNINKKTYIQIYKDSFVFYSMIYDDIYDKIYDMETSYYLYFHRKKYQPIFNALSKSIWDHMFAEIYFDISKKSILKNKKRRIKKYFL